MRVEDLEQQAIARGANLPKDALFRHSRPPQKGVQGGRETGLCWGRDASATINVTPNKMTIISASPNTLSSLVRLLNNTAITILLTPLATFLVLKSSNIWFSMSSFRDASKIYAAWGVHDANFLLQRNRMCELRGRI